MCQARIGWFFALPLAGALSASNTSAQALPARTALAAPPPDGAPLVLAPAPLSSTPEAKERR